MEGLRGRVAGWVGRTLKRAVDAVKEAKEKVAEIHGAGRDLGTGLCKCSEW